MYKKEPLMIREKKNMYKNYLPSDTEEFFLFCVLKSGIDKNIFNFK